MKQDSFLRSGELSTTRKPTDDIRPRFDDSAACEDFGESENIFLSAERSCSANFMPDDVLRVDWLFWRASQSEFRYRGEPNVIDLGEL